MKKDSGRDCNRFAWWCAACIQRVYGDEAVSLVVFVEQQQTKEEKP